jgi:hypothetical protein
MVEGRLAVPMEKTVTQDMMTFTPELIQQNVPPAIETFTSCPIWEEKTGEKKGLIFKRDEIRKMRLVGYRCSLCNYVELYARS